MHVEHSLPSQEVTTSLLIYLIVYFWEDFFASEGNSM